VLGLVFTAAGVMPILGGLGVIPFKSSPGTPAPPWLLLCVGLAFSLAGVAIAFDALAGRRRHGRDRFSVQLIQYLLGLAMASTLTAPFVWIAFGPGERRFAMTLYIPFVAEREAANEITGRIAFGLGAVMMIAVTVAIATSGARRLLRARAASTSTPAPDTLPGHAPDGGRRPRP
jgi:hypothetical protein